SIIGTTAESLMRYAVPMKYTQGTRVVTADLNGDGAEDILVPAGQMLVLDGRSFASSPSSIVPVSGSGAGASDMAVDTTPTAGGRVTRGAHHSVTKSISCSTAPTRAGSRSAKVCTLPSSTRQ